MRGGHGSQAQPKEKLARSASRQGKRQQRHQRAEAAAAAEAAAEAAEEAEEAKAAAAAAAAETAEEAEADETASCRTSSFAGDLQTSVPEVVRILEQAHPADHLDRHK